MEDINWKENKEIQIPMKKPNFSTSVSKNDYSYLDSTILFWKETKIFMETLLNHQKATEK